MTSCIKCCCIARRHYTANVKSEKQKKTEEQTTADKLTMATRSNFDFGMDEVLQVSQSSSQSSVIDEEEMVRMEQEATPESTSKATQSGMNKFLSWKIKREIDINFHSITATSLALILRRFYAEVKKENGKPLTPSSLVGIRAALNRYLVGAPFYRKMNVVSGPEFVIANKMFDTKCKLYYKANNPKPRHKPVIEKEDMKKLGAYFKNYYQNPVILTRRNVVALREGITQQMSNQTKTQRNRLQQTS